jgi:hypothetical protein
MLRVQRVTAAGAALSTASVGVFITESAGTESNDLLLCTLWTLSDNNVFPPATITSSNFRGQGWTGSLFWFDTQLFIPGSVYPLVLVKPKRVTETIRQRCIHVDLAPPLPPKVTVPSGLPIRWRAGGGVTMAHNYSRNPTTTIDHCQDATFVAGPAGAAPGQSNEGEVAEFDGGDGLDRFGIVVDVNLGAIAQAITLRNLLNDPRFQQAIL